MRSYSTLWMVIVDCIVLHYMHICHLRIRASSLQFRASKINIPQITLAFQWPTKINTMLMQRSFLLRHSRLANINNTIYASSGKWKRHPTCPIRQVKMILWYVQFLKSKMINIELFSVGSRGEFYLNIASYVSYFDRKGSTHQGLFSKIRTPQITLAFQWPTKINTMLMQRSFLLRHSRLANINNTIWCSNFRK
jgi:hypothetical protein